MLRVWVLSALLVGAVVAGFLYFEPGGGTEGRRTAPPPKDLTDREIRVYIAVFTPLYAQLHQVAVDFAQGRPTADTQALVDRLARENKVTRDELEEIRNRVNGAVEAIRWEMGYKEWKARLEAEIEEKRRQAAMTGGDTRKVLDADLRQLEGMRDAKGPWISERSRVLVQSYWAQLDSLVPRTAGDTTSPRSAEGQPTPPPR